MPKIEPHISYDHSTNQLTIRIDLWGMEEEILTAYGLKPIKSRAGKTVRSESVGAKPGRRGRPKNVSGKVGRPKKAAKGVAAVKPARARKRRSSAEVQESKAQKELSQKARKALRLPLRGRLKPEDQERLEKKVTELRNKLVSG